MAALAWEQLEQGHNYPALGNQRARHPLEQIGFDLGDVALDAGDTGLGLLAQGFNVGLGKTVDINDRALVQAIAGPGCCQPPPCRNLRSATTSPPWAISAPTSHLIRSDLTSAISRWTPAILALVS